MYMMLGVINMKGKPKLEFVLKKFIEDMGLEVRINENPKYYMVFSPEKNLYYVIDKPNSSKELGIYATNVVSYFDKYQELAEFLKDKYKV